MPVERHHRNPISKLIGEAGIIGIDDLQLPAVLLCAARHERQSSRTQLARPASHESHQRHQREDRAPWVRTQERGIVERLMRPATVLAIVLLLVILTVAGVVFVIQLLSVT